MNQRVVRKGGLPRRVDQQNPGRQSFVRRLIGKLIPRSLTTSWRHGLTVLVVAGVAMWPGTKRPGLNFASHSTPPVIENELDAALYETAKNALGSREGAVIVIDPQTGRLRAVVNSNVALENAYAPGSTIKPFTTLAALELGLIDRNSRALCRERYARGGFVTVCAHKHDLPPFNPAEAIAYSCNYYFGRLGEQLPEKSLSDTLYKFGFGKRASIGPRENDGQLLRGKADPRNALGEGDHLLANPVQLLTAYTALVNGGHLFTAGEASAAEFQFHERAQISITSDHRALLLAGMRGAVVFGTASRAGLNSAGLNVFGKTGTSTPIKGFRSQGWFVGFAADPASETAAPEEVRLGVLVFLKTGHGVDAAKVSQPIFAEFERWQGQLGTPAAEPSPRPPSAAETNSRSTVTSGAVRVHLVTENITDEMPLEDYVTSVVATEGSMENQPEALKALAVAVRTFAMHNLGRHAKDGYDFCSTTHCQRYQPLTGNTLSEAQRNARALNAVRATSGEVLRDRHAGLADAYFSASCGGMTANVETLWGTNAPAYLRGVRDESCATMPHHSWTDAISMEQLARALRSDERTNPGSRLTDVRVARRDSTGRAELIAINGDQRRIIRGWDFKIIVGRVLGWNVLKSSRFEVTRAGSNFVFRGTGFGHGLGLCQEGAHVMAERGASYEQILAKYFPGTSVKESVRKSLADANRPPATYADLVWTFTKKNELNRVATKTFATPPTKRTSLSSEHFRVTFPVSTPQRDAEDILKTLENARTGLLQRIALSGVSIQFPAPEIFVNATTGDFVGRTGQPWWAAAATKSNLIELQPVATLKRRGVLETTLRHELVHIAVEKLSHGQAPRWLAEGMAIYFAGEGAMVSRFQPKRKLSASEIDERLLKAASAEDMRQAYAAAYREVSELIGRDGETKVWQLVARASRQ
jgi:stage II sporulation protein D